MPKILVVEDEERVRSYAAEALIDLGYAVETAHDGQTALTWLRDGKAVDLLFTDVATFRATITSPTRCPASWSRP